MDKSEVLNRLRTTGLVPVIRTATAADAVAISEALQAVGLSNLEITLTVPGAMDVIRDLSKRFGSNVILGAGTVLDARAAEASIAAGARFIVSPSLDLETIAYCKKAGVAIFAGSLTPTEVLTAWKAGADMVKIFPASAVGGAAYLKALKGPFPQIEMIPTGGVSVDTAAAFIQAGAAALGVGGDLVDPKALREGRVAEIGARAQRYIDIVKQARG